MTELCEHVAESQIQVPHASLKSLCAAVQLPRGTFYAWRRADWRGTGW